MKNLIFGHFIFFLSLTAVFAISKTDIIVASDGSGDFISVQEAMLKVPNNNTKEFVIYIKSGIYKEQIKVLSSNVTLIGESKKNTKLTFNLSNKDVGSTSASYSFYVAGNDFRAENLTFENSFGVGSQAVAVLVEADKAIFKNCNFLGWQDTLYAKNGRQLYQDCYIEGDVDFIFGQATVYFENCVIHSKGDGYIAAPMRFAADEASGFVFNRCKLTGENIKKGVYLARPWRPFGRAVFLNSQMGEHIKNEGFNNWNNISNENTAYFAEFNSSGKGAKSDERVKWSKQLTKEESKQFEVEKFLLGWNPDKKQTTKTVYNSTTWNDVFAKPAIWYATDEAARIADQVVFYQHDNGGWEKNLDMALMLNLAEKSEVTKRKSENTETTIDNNTTTSQLVYLAKVNTASLTKSTPPTNFEKHKIAFNKGFDYLLTSQYENGGFPQFFPLKKGYYSHITFNDNAMVNVLKLFRDIAKQKTDYKFVDEDRRTKAEKAVAKGIECVLKTQTKQNNQLTVWGQQYDEVTLQPAWARKFEPISLASTESVNIVRFLMTVENPNKEVIDSIENAILWFKKSKISGYKWVNMKNKNATNWLLVADKNAETWARFYDIEHNRPIFLGRDSVIHFKVTEIEDERRNGYRWYSDEPIELLDSDYLKWKKKRTNN
jgi:PelA/Pel-15E family pectate lyase